MSVFTTGFFGQDLPCRPSLEACLTLAEHHSRQHRCLVCVRESNGHVRAFDCGVEVSPAVADWL